MFDVITFGSAAWDAYMDLPPKFVKKSAHFTPAKDLVFDLGSKIDVPGTRFAFGGGGINTARTFAAQGLLTAYCGMAGDDIPGREAVAYLNELGIDTGFLSKTAKKATNNSVVLNAPGTDRVILVYRGASELLAAENIDWQKLNAKLFYLAPLSGKLCRLTERITLHAKKQGAVVAANLGNSQLAMGRACIKSLLARIDVLILNQEEAATMTGVDYADEAGIIKKIVHMHSGISVITKGEDGAAVVAGGKIYEAKLKKFKIANITGAGDAFGSGFMSGMLASGNNIEYSMRLALINAKHCLLSRIPEGLPASRTLRLIEQENIKIKIHSL
ncbi:MAG TPA: carbohydrate kinase family protein [Candidatus Pacearchaeota archaeon]|nr:carbohydrate kinase family protein [Candidatus Pacearchaeota archaeon]